MFTHEDVKENHCPYCSKSFSKKRRLRNHILKHVTTFPTLETSSLQTQVHIRGMRKTVSGEGESDSAYEDTHGGTAVRLPRVQKDLHHHRPPHRPQAYSLRWKVKAGLIFRPYVCPECGSRFMRSNILKVHMRKHTGDKPYTCCHPGCDKSFAQKGNMAVHVKAHVIKVYQ